jgi:IclR family transcriptional regulator, KDG regulon repressor
MTEDPERKSSHYVQSLRNGLGVLLAFSRERTELGITELSHLMDLDKTVVFKLAHTLTAEGFLVRDPSGRRYRLGPRIVQVAASFSSFDVLVNQGTLYIRELSRIIGMSTAIGIIDGLSVLYVAAIEADASVKAAARAGDHRPLHATATGKCLLAFLPAEARDEIIGRMTLDRWTSSTRTDRNALLEDLALAAERGYAVNVGERVNGLRGIAAPVWDHRGITVAALSCAIPMGLVNEDGFNEIIDQTVNSAAALSRSLGAAPIVHSETTKELR